MNFSAEFFNPEIAALMMALFWAAILIDLMVGQFVTGKVPSLDALFARVARALVRRLDRSSRTYAELRMRGILLVMIIIPPLVYAGILANELLEVGIYGPLLSALALVPLVAQKHRWQQLISAGGAISQAKGQLSENGDDIHHTRRLAVADTILGFCASLVPLGAWWSVGGFAGLFPYLLVANLMKAASRRRNGAPASPFFMLITLLHEVAVAPFAILAALLVGLAHFFLPGTNLGVFASFNPAATIGLASRYFPLNTIARGLELAVEADIGETTSKPEIKKPVCWVGPTSGRAKLEPAMMRKVWFVTLIGFSLYGVVTAMIFTLLLLA